MKVIRILIIGLMVIAFSSQAHARSCDRDEYDKAEYFSEKAGEQMVGKYGGGSDIRVTMRSCSYNSYSGIFNTKIEIYWNGVVFSGNKYNIDGELKIKSNGTQVRFSETYANSNVKDIRFWGYFVGAAVVLSAITAENQ